MPRTEHALAQQQEEVMARRMDKGFGWSGDRSHSSELQHAVNTVAPKLCCPKLQKLAAYCFATLRHCARMFSLDLSNKLFTVVYLLQTTVGV